MSSVAQSGGQLYQVSGPRRSKRLADLEPFRLADKIARNHHVQPLQLPSCRKTASPASTSMHCEASVSNFPASCGTLQQLGERMCRRRCQTFNSLFKLVDGHLPCRMPSPPGLPRASAVVLFPSNASCRRAAGPSIPRVLAGFMLYSNCFASAISIGQNGAVSPFPPPIFSGKSVPRAAAGALLRGFDGKRDFP